MTDLNGPHVHLNVHYQITEKHFIARQMLYLQRLAASHPRMRCGQSFQISEDNEEAGFLQRSTATNASAFYILFFFAVTI